MLATVVAGAFGAVGAALGHVAPANASNGEPILLGARNEASEPTTIERISSGPAFVARASGPGVGAVGSSPTGIGVYGIADVGHGIVGSSVSGTGVEARSEQGIALRITRGRLSADLISGVAVVPVGDVSVDVKPQVPVDATAFVLLAPMVDLQDRSAWVTTQPDERTFTVHLSREHDLDVRVGWLMIG